MTRPTRLALLLPLFLGACGPRVSTTLLAGGYPPNPDGAEITVSTLTYVECPFVELGLVTVRDSEFNFDYDYLGRLKDEARALGGDAVIGLREVDPVSDEYGEGLSGIVIRYAEADCMR